jgi:uncharacterized protein (TIGR03435 family)
MVRAILFALTMAAAFGQPAFEVLSIHKMEAKTGFDPHNIVNVQAAPGSLRMRAVTMKSAIAWAYHVMEYQVSGPDWLNFERYDISGKAGSAGEDALREMLQTALADRFQLKFHRQTKELPAYILTIAKGGIKFHESDTNGEPALAPDREKMKITVQHFPAQQFITVLSNILRAPVINETGLTGNYDVSLDVSKYMPQAGDAPPDPIAIIMRGLQEELGLKLESKKIPLDLLVIDHAEKIPAEN